MQEYLIEEGRTLIFEPTPYNPNKFTFRIKESILDSYLLLSNCKQKEVLKKNIKDAVKGIKDKFEHPLNESKSYELLKYIVMEGYNLTHWSETSPKTLENYKEGDFYYNQSYLRNVYGFEVGVTFNFTKKEEGKKDFFRHVSILCEKQNWKEKRVVEELEKFISKNINKNK